eukprot:PhM_4_TR576/c0_g1_i1/m.44005
MSDTPLLPQEHEQQRQQQTVLRDDAVNIIPAAVVLEANNGDNGDEEVEVDRRHWSSLLSSHEFISARSKAFRSRVCWAEFSGAVGDLGTFLPLLLAMSQKGSLHLTPALFFAGVFNVITGLLWDVPMAVQPMKSVAAIAIAKELTPEQVSLAGLWAGGIIFLLGVTRLMPLLTRVVPASVVKGIQLGLGLSLFIKALAAVLAHNKQWFEWDGIFCAVVIAAAIAILLEHFPRVPAALLFILIGTTVSLVRMAVHASSVGTYRFEAPIDLVAQRYEEKDVLYSLWSVAVPQLPLTALNSVVSVCELAIALYGDTKPPGTAEVASSVGLMNLLACPFGAMPMCHGAGGLAAQHRFGARCGLSIVFLGAVKMLAALALGSYAAPFLMYFPVTILNVLLMVSGVQLALCAKLMGANDEEAQVTLVTAAVSLSLNVAYGAATGVVLHVIFNCRPYVDALKDQYLKFLLRGARKKESN